ncbi:hypothetical protein [Arthrobacter sp. fls2-241-R2A-200]|uniref:hypothetical protein n=1 Tax=Arthrobacter sp. fls2-241-R2A-200 TaxID=3040281 RepID=UPI00254B054C|nr:hypothetical protein [Arthrobacter sp. fls2-241-R2A-200]
MTALFWIAIVITCAASIAAAYLVVADYWRDRSASTRDRITNVTRDAHESVNRLEAAYRRAMHDMRRDR